MTPVRSYAFVFVCQAGLLENKALLLAASLKRFLRIEHELIVAVPSPVERWGALAPETTELLKALDCRFEPIKNDVADDYPIGNKISCMRLSTKMDRLVFIDSDILLTRPFEGDSAFDFPFAAKPVDLANLVEPRQWRRAYAAMKLPLPNDRVASTVYTMLVHPYFNAGLIAADPKTGFGDVWLEACRRIDAKWGIKLKRPHLDQIALPVAVKKLNLTYFCLSEKFNYPAHIKPIDNAKPPIFAHYHSPHVLRREPMLVDLARTLCDEHPILKRRISADPEYSGLLADNRVSVSTTTEPVPVAHKDPTPELIITGFPRSGTSYLCNLLHRFENCVVLNEPEGISRPLRKEVIPFGIGTFYRDQRREILERKPIKNKLRDGKVTDETMEANEQSEYVPTVSSPDFVLGVKSPLGFLSRLPAIHRAMPDARLVICVRNPYDVIASWKTTFSHLLSADVKKMSHGGLRDPFLSNRQRDALKDVSKIKSPAWRRAAWWRYLAEQILDMRNEAIIVPYPLAVSDPMSVMNRLLHGHNAGALREPIEPSTVRAAKRSALDDEDIQAIRSLCSTPAATLDVWDE